MSDLSAEGHAQVHLLAIRKALANRNAAVMVGAGFSRNAEGGHNLATWRQLSEALATELDPLKSPGDFSPAAAAQLAEQYARVFSPTHLEQLIKRLVPDDQVTPGPLHTQLLKLPWSEVFTTNYDTLLERSAERLFDASYFTVCAREDIPQSKVLGRRRIVKLHGSFPSHRPFILTEEEYRTYPERFAPFVNLVRQSLLENVFCLIGFSGDDPNFLHWLGWVRDMLDKHALPVYLFLGHEPTLGERKLYEARGVVPVVLPIPNGVSRSDYSARYRALFDELARPLADSPLDWGSFSPPLELSLPRNTAPDQQFSHFLKQLPDLFTYRCSYPGWLVAPQKIRINFRRTAEWLENMLWQRDLQLLLSQRPATITLSVADLYNWAQRVMLEPLSDDIAEMSLSAFLAKTTENSEKPTAEEQTFLEAIGCTGSGSQNSTRINVGLALLTWARQGHRTAAYNQIRAQLESLATEDTTVQERLTYEAILLDLQRGDHPSALRNALIWRPKGSDAYVHVLRGSLLAEVGETTSALQVLEQAIQVLRRQQRSRPDDPGLISQEAWACLVARNVQRSIALGAVLRAASSGSDLSLETREGSGEDFERRLNALGARGYSAEQEVESLRADLNSESQLPLKATSRLQGFDLSTGTSRRLLMQRSDFSGKIIASLAWLELVERTGLPPQTRNVTFFVEQLLQAAWWARFADTPQRSIGLLLRARRENALDSRDDSLPPHRSGWLGRYEIARFTSDSVEEICTDLIAQICAEFEKNRASSGSKSRATFLLKVFSHLTIRVKNETALELWGGQLIDLHLKSSVRGDSGLWNPLSVAIGRVLEALPETLQSKLILRASDITLAPPTSDAHVLEHELSGWLSFKQLFRHWHPDAIERSRPQWRVIAARLIQQLNTRHDKHTAQQIWQRLVDLCEKGLLNDAELKAIGSALWANVAQGKWPTIPGYQPAATLLWPGPRRNVASLLLDRMLSRPLRPFSSGGYMQLSLGKGSRSYYIGGLDSTLGTINRAVHQTTPTLSQIGKLINEKGDWFDEQLHNFVLDLHEEQLHDELARAVEFIDEILAQCFDFLTQRTLTNQVENLLKKIIAIDERLQILQIPRYQMSLARMRKNEPSEKALQAYAVLIIEAFIDKNERTSWTAARAAFVLLREEESTFHGVAKVVFDAVLGCVFAQRLTSLDQAMNLLANLPAAAWLRNLDQRSSVLLNIAFDDLAPKLAYDPRDPEKSMPDESIPSLRYKTFQLAHTVIHTAKAQIPAAQTWLDTAKNDPLPEIRFGRFGKSN